MSKQRGIDQATRYVRRLIELSGCKDEVRIAEVVHGTKHFAFILENRVGMQGRLTMSHGGLSRAGSAVPLQKSNIHIIRTVAAARKSA